nr:hypothetical protein [Burkholderia sp. Ac-20379]
STALGTVASTGVTTVGAVGNVVTQTVGAVGAALPGVAITPSSGTSGSSGSSTGAGTLLSPVTSLVTTLAGAALPRK